jgi:hypothetical protein
MQQLLDKWERLRRSEYLRPDEKLMLNHCISDLKRFIDHSVDVTEMVGKQQTAVEWLSEQFDSIVELYPSEYEKVNRAIEQAKEMFEEQIEKAYDDAIMKGRQEDGEQYYNETYGGGEQ